MNVLPDTIQAVMYVLNVDCLSRNAKRLCAKALNIRYGNGVPVVVRAEESSVHGEGGQFIRFNTTKGRMREALRNPKEVLENLKSKGMKATPTNGCTGTYTTPICFCLRTKGYTPSRVT